MQEWESIEELAEVLKLLGVGLRLRILGLLAEGPKYVWEISKRLNVSYPLVYLHLSALEKKGLVEAEYVTEGGRVRRYYRVRDFDIRVNPEVLRRLVRGEGGEG